MKQLNKLSLIFLGALVMASCVSKSGSVQEANQTSSAALMISKVELSSDGTQLVVHANKEPKYNVFKLMDPERIVVDIIDAKLQDGATSVVAENDVVKELKVQALEDSLSSLVRMEIVLKNSANYMAELTSDGMSLRILKGGEMPPEVAKNDVTPPAVQPEKQVEKAPEGSPTEGNALPLPPLPALPVPEANALPLPAIPAPVPSPEVAAPSLSAPIPEAAAPVVKPEEIAKNENLNQNAEVKPPEMKATEQVPEAKIPEVKEEAKAEPVPETPKTDQPEANVPVPAPLPVLPPAENEKAKSAEAEKTPTGATRLKPVANQEIPSILTEGTSLLTELDSKVYTGRRVSIEFQDADVQDILKLIADVSKLNIVTGDDVKGKLSLKLIDVPWDQALDIILTTLGLDKTQHGNIIRVAPSDKLRKEREVALANDKAAKQLEPLKLKLINVNYAKAEDLSSRIKNLLSDRGTVDTDSRTNTLIVKDIREHISRVENLVKALDTQTPQVRIEARIVQANDQFSKDLGIEWGPILHLDGTNSKPRSWQFPRTITAGSPDAASTFSLAPYAVEALPGSATAGQLGFRLGSINNIFELDLKLQYLEQESLGRVVSRPSISVLDNKTAHIIQGSKVPFLSSSQNGTSVSFQDVGIQISVTPQITSDGAVILKIQTSSNEILATSVGGNPITTIREAQTEMLVKSGRTAVLGGVFKTSDTSSKAGVPGLYNLPVIGWLFGSDHKNTTREETLVFVTPYILNDARVATSTPNSESSIEH